LDGAGEEGRGEDEVGVVAARGDEADGVGGPFAQADFDGNWEGILTEFAVADLLILHGPRARVRRMGKIR
jgi:hypothetical protein